MKKLKSPLTILGILIIIIVVAKAVLINTSPIPEKSNFTVNWDKVESLASAPPEQLPQKINAEVIAQTEFPLAYISAGTSLFEKLPIVIAVYQLEYAKGGHILIDTGLSQTLHEKLGGPFYQRNYERMQAAMLQANHIVLTHEHFDHIGGISQSPNLNALTANTRLTVEQINGPRIENAKFRHGDLKKFTPLVYKQLHRLAPGVVLIKAPGHSTGSQLVFVRTADGKRFLFTGDIVWNRLAFQREQGKPRLGQLMIKENREQVANQMRFLLTLQKEKKYHQVISHDGAQLDKFIKDGIFQRGLSVK